MKGAKANDKKYTYKDIQSAIDMALKVSDGKLERLYAQRDMLSGIIKRLSDMLEDVEADIFAVEYQRDNEMLFKGEG